MVMLETLKRYLGEGWVEAGETWTYVSADSSINATTVYTGTITAPGDVTGEYELGMKVMFTQTTVKYGILVAKSYSAGTGLTTMVLYLGTDYQLVSAEITSNCYSTVKNPLGFPQSRAKWDIYYSRTSATATASPTVSVWYNNGGSLIVPVGLWKLSYRTFVQSTLASTTTVQVLTTLSTANNSESDAEMTSWGLSMYPVNPNTVYGVLMNVPKTVAVASESTYYLNVMARQSSQSNLTAGSAVIPLLIRGECIYI